MVYVLLYKLRSDNTTGVVKVYNSEVKAMSDMEMLKSVSTDRRFKIFQSELESTNKSRSEKKSTPKESNEFETFWAAYPKKTSKGLALEAWNKVNPPLDDVLKALAWQVKSNQWTTEGGKFTPNPTTYINQARWHDEKRDIDLTPTGKPWFIVGSAIEAKGKELGLEQTRDEAAFQFYDRVRKEAGITRDMVNKATQESRMH